MPFPGIFNWNLPNWGQEQGQKVWDWWDKLGVTEPQQAGFFERFPKPQGGSSLAALADWFARSPSIENRPTMPSSPYRSEDEIAQMMEERDRQYPDDPLRNRGWQQSQLPQGQYYKKRTPDYSDWSW